MQWNRSNTIGLGRLACTFCNGSGTRVVRETSEVPCDCVFRAIFRICYKRFRESAARSLTGTVTFEYTGGCDGHRMYSRKWEDYMADFCLVARRELDVADYNIFRYFFLLGANWKITCDRLKIDRAKLFYSLYRIEAVLGRAFAELEPYPLYPVDEYFTEPTLSGTHKQEPVPVRRERKPIRPKLRLTA